MYNYRPKNAIAREKTYPSMDVGVFTTPNVERVDKTLDVKGLYIFDDKEASLLRGQKFSRRSYSGSNYTSAVTDYLVGITSLAIAPSVGLPRPSLVGAGKTYIVKDEAGGAATTTITIRSDGERTIDGATSATITTNYGVGRYYSDGSNWFSW